MKNTRCINISISHQDCASPEMGPKALQMSWSKYLEILPSVIAHVMKEPRMWQHHCAQPSHFQHQKPNFSIGNKVEDNPKKS